MLPFSSRTMHCSIEDAQPANLRLKSNHCTFEVLNLVYERWILSKWSAFDHCEGTCQLPVIICGMGKLSFNFFFIH